MKIGFLGNCQIQGVAESAKAFAPYIEITFHPLVGVHPLDPTAINAIINDMFECDVVFIQALEARRPDFKPLITAIVDRHPSAVRFPMIAFRGFHPDCGHLRRGNTPVQGALGPYQSIIACAGWLEGMPPEETVSLFNSFTYAALGYFDVYDASRTLLINQSVALGYDLSVLFSEQQKNFMHTVNHPTSSVLHEVARQSLDIANISRLEKATTPNDYLSDGWSWPIYPEIAKRIYTRDTIITKEYYIIIRNIVENNYRSLQNDRDTYGPLDLVDLAQPNGDQIGRARAFIREFVIRKT